MHPRAKADLQASGLEPTDLKARDIAAPELAAVGLSVSNTLGYVIPYFDIQGTPVAHYRINLLDRSPKYRQPSGSPLYIYFPPNLQKVLKSKNKKHSQTNYIIITEGEKKACAAVKNGFPAVGLGGVDCWRNRTLILPENTVLDPIYKDGKTGSIRARLPSTKSEVVESSTLAVGLTDLIDFVVEQDFQLLIAFDSDLPGGRLKPEVQRAASQFGYELRFLGVQVQHIRQLLLSLPSDIDEGEKIGLDDLLIAAGPEYLEDLIEEVLAQRNAFPRHPNPKGYVNKKLQQGRMNRRDSQNISMAILTELDANGRRLRTKSSQIPYYFDEQTLHLMPASLLQHHGEPLHESHFGNHLYQKFGLSAYDTKTITWLASQFTGESPIDEVEPCRVLAPTTLEDPNNISVQISDSQFVIVTPNAKRPLIVMGNGSNGVLFEGDQVDPIDGGALLKEFTSQLKKPVRPWWAQVLNTLNISEGEEYSRYGKRTKDVMTLLFYISPWLHRWQGAQLPVEIVVGEAGSGKSSIYELRLRILTGRPMLRNAPTDLRDWYSSVANTGGLHVLDNVQFTNKDLQQRISDEIAQPLDAQVLTPTGFRRIGDLQVGDEVITPKGAVAPITAIHPRGVKEVYRVEFHDGSSTECCVGHLWYTESRHQRTYGSLGSVKTLHEIMATPLKGHYPGDFQNYIPIIASSVNLTPKEGQTLPLDPYLLGALLGDGCFRMNQPDFANTDQYIVDKVAAALPEGNHLRLRQKGVYAIGGATNPVREACKALELWDLKSKDKFVPEAYKWTTAPNRLAILQGLMDTDGTVNCHGSPIFNTTSPKLAEDVRWLVQSLGGTATKSIAANRAYSIGIRMPQGLYPVSLPRKLKRYQSSGHHNPLRAIKKIVSVDSKEVKCISLGSEEGLYVTDSFVITHNCRLTTEPKPHIEMRRLYTTTSQVRIPIKVVFAITAIQHQFHNADLMQRSAIFNLLAIRHAHDSKWVEHQLQKRGGRIKWLAHHLVVLHKFLNYVVHKGSWDSEYMASHRLAHYEQSLQVMAEVLGLDSSWIAEGIAEGTEKFLSEADWALEGLKAFADARMKAGNYSEFTSQTISQWCQVTEDFADNTQLTNSRRLGRYIQSHKYTIERVTRIQETGTRNNRRTFQVKV